MDNIIQKINNCKECLLYQTRKNVVIGEGNVNADLLWVGEAPGANEDLTGKPFCGRSGALLTKMIAAMGFNRDEVYIANILKCRPPENRNPTQFEIGKCKHFLAEQIRLINPTAIITLGNFAMKEIIGDKSIKGITKEHGKIFEIDSFYSEQSIVVIPTFHPAYLLRNPAKKKECWEDLQIVMEVIGKK